MTDGEDGNGDGLVTFDQQVVERGKNKAGRRLSRGDGYGAAECDIVHAVGCSSPEVQHTTRLCLVAVAFHGEPAGRERFGGAATVGDTVTTSRSSSTVVTIAELPPYRSDEP
jgi:hypothetical protein